MRGAGVFELRFGFSDSFDLHAFKRGSGKWNGRWVKGGAVVGVGDCFLRLEETLKAFIYCLYLYLYLIG